MVKTSQVDNKRIAKNTLILYFRMAITMIVSLYTSRVVLSALGVDDYGIYNVVGGVVALLNVISGSMTAATSRFLSYELGQRNSNRLSDTFSTLLNVHILIGIIVYILGEFIGIWFIENKLIIPVDRIDAAIWVLQFSLFTFFCTVINVPYSSSVISHEKMGVFAYIAIIEVVAKLGIAFILTCISFDRLIIYAFLLALVSVIIQVVYYLHCRRYSECRFRLIFDIPLLKNITSFIGWAFLGNASVVIKTQGVTVLLNMFFGPVVNAAQGIANQVESISSRFVQSYMMASNPQIIKLYSASEYKQMHNLIYRTSKFSSFLLMFIIAPIFLNIQFILSIWLEVVPSHSANFVKLILFYNLFDALTGPLVTGLLATSKIRRYELYLSITYLFSILLTYFAFKGSMPPEIAFWISIIFKMIVWGLLLKEAKERYELSVAVYFKKVIIPIIAPILLVVVLYVASIDEYVNSISYFILYSILVEGLLSLVIWFMGLERDERTFIIGIAGKILTRI